ncbi:hypothetical protein [Photobacterium kishitanii]|uniref:Uncharacterized protein n=1 Tax=Photobacterium kishitanii TaxID=318456 RepID=A0A2T3KLK9_9GAMM|nr:hypothetical protein [Photobacterium kishitanii]PSV00543.1 hypothetical protein C9J27_05255 [Photobacterium kishitanii]
MFTITKKNIGDKLFGIPLDEAAKREDLGRVGYKEIAISSVGRINITFSCYSEKSKQDADHIKRSKKYRVHTGKNNQLGFSEDLIQLIGEYGHSWLVFEDEDKCAAFVKKQKLITSIRSNIDMYTLESTLGMMDIEALAYIDEAFFNAKQK